MKLLLVTLCMAWLPQLGWAQAADGDAGEEVVDTLDAAYSAMSTQACDASTMAEATSGRMMPPESRVAGPLALMRVRTPRPA